jgi:hypothetical protein
MCAFHNSVNFIDIMYEIGKLMYDELPSIIFEYTGRVMEFFRKKWGLPPVLSELGISEETVINLNRMQVHVCTGLIGVLADSPLPASRLQTGSLDSQSI